MKILHILKQLLHILKVGGGKTRASIARNSERSKPEPTLLHFKKIVSRYLFIDFPSVHIIIKSEGGNINY